MSYLTIIFLICIFAVSLSIFYSVLYLICYTILKLHKKISDNNLYKILIGVAAILAALTYEYVMQLVLITLF